MKKENYDYSGFIPNAVSMELERDPICEIFNVGTAKLFEKLQIKYLDIKDFFTFINLGNPIYKKYTDTIGSDKREGLILIKNSRIMINFSNIDYNNTTINSIIESVVEYLLSYDIRKYVKNKDSLPSSILDILNSSRYMVFKRSAKIYDISIVIASHYGNKKLFNGEISLLKPRIH